jgi:phosphoribosylformylglycinamidine synthase
MRDACLALEVPVVSGNVSFYNETDGVPIYPTPTIGMVGLLSKVERAITPWFKSSGDTVLLLGRTREELGGTEYLKIVHGLVKGTPPWIDLKLEQAVHNTCIEAIERGILRSAHDVSDGGLGVTLAECCFGPEKPIGARIDTHEMIRGDALLFSESQARIVVSARDKDVGELHQIAAKHGAPVHVIGNVGGSRLTVRPLIQLPVEELKMIWASSLEKHLK